MDSSIYDEEYFLRGKQSGKSLYDNYRWLPELTCPMSRRLVEHLKLEWSHKILDYGCSRGYIVKALRQLGMDAWGIDASEWAIANADPDIEVGRLICGDASTLLSAPRNFRDFDWIIAKDVLEHVHDVADCINILMDKAAVGVFAVVPLSLFDGQPYIVAEYEKDITHIHRLSLSTWASYFFRPGWKVEGRYRLDGVKDNYAAWERGNGFLTAKRI